MSGFQVNLPKIPFYPELFNNLLVERGIGVTWEKATMCPCVRADQAGRTQFTCGDCSNGWTYIDSQDILAVVTNVTGQRNAAVWGDLALGGVFVTVNGMYRLGVGDRITLKQSTTRYSELCKLASGVVKVVPSAGATTLTLDNTRRFPSPGDKVMYAKIGTGVFTYTGKTDTSLTGIPASGAGSLPTGITGGAKVVSMMYRLRYNPTFIYDVRSDATVFTLGADVSGLSSGLLWWKNSVNMPTDQFTILYDSYPVYIVDTMNHEFRDQISRRVVDKTVVDRLPVAVVCRKDFIGTNHTTGK